MTKKTMIRFEIVIAVILTALTVYAIVAIWA